MTFYAANFIYDGIPASQYGLRISSLSDSGSDHAGADVELITQSIYRKPNVYLLGVKQSPILSIPVTFTVNGELSSKQSAVISRWLFGRDNYKKLQIVQDDMQYVYFNCMLQNPTVIRVGNIIRGYNANIVCDSPFAWEFPKRISYTFDTYLLYENIDINNTSDVSDYIYPQIEIKTNQFGGYFSIINKSDNNRVFMINNLSPSKYYRIDNNMQSATRVDNGENCVPYMKDNGYKWFRYIKGLNKLTVVGNIDYLSFINHFPRKVS